MERNMMYHLRASVVRHTALAGFMVFGLGTAALAQDTPPTNNPGQTQPAAPQQDGTTQAGVTLMNKCPDDPYNCGGGRIVR
jgi:hypothetical protein